MAEEKTSGFPINTILIVLLIGAAFTIGLFWQKIQMLESAPKKNVSGTADTGSQPAQPVAQKVAEVSKVDHIRGKADAPITWIEYSDLECPYCASIHQSLVKLIDEYDGKVRWIYRHFPLSQIHPKARELAIGSECAAVIGGEDKFWEYVDYVFNNNSKDANAVAQAIGVGSPAFSTCITSEETADKVDADYDSGVAAGVNGTPGNFVINPNGDQRSVPGALPLDQLKATVDQLL